jgi:acetyl-CoA carboxylase carboxyl transferase subunit alpha
MVFLDFEKPIEEIVVKIDELRAIQEKTGTNQSVAIDELEESLTETRSTIYSNLSTWQRIQVSRHPERPYSLFYIQYLCENFIELFGDRHYKDDKAIVGGFGDIQGETVMFIGHQKGINTKMRQYRNFGMANPKAIEKHSA